MTVYLYVFPETNVGAGVTVRPPVIDTLPLSEARFRPWPGTGTKVTRMPSVVSSARPTVSPSAGEVIRASVPARCTVAVAPVPMLPALSFQPPSRVIVTSPRTKAGAVPKPKS